MQASRAINSPADLVDVCEQAGASVRRTTRGGHLVKGPNGSVTIPSNWEHGRGRHNVLAEVQKIGLDLSAAEPAQPAKKRDIPALMEVVPMDQPKPAPTPLDIPKQRPGPAPASQADLDALLELVEKLSARFEELSTKADDRFDTLTRRVAKVEKLATGGSEPTQLDRARQVREEILDLFRKLPPGMRVPAGVVTTNLGEAEDKDVYRRQLTRLVELEELQAHGTGSGRQYSLPAPTAEEN